MAERMLLLRNIDTQHDSKDRSPRKATQRRTGLTWRSMKSPLLIPLFIFVVLLLAASLAPLTSATDQSLVDRLIPPLTSGGTWIHPLGTDGLGRDLVSRILQGARTSLLIATVSSSIAAVIGISIGVLSGLLGGWPDRILTLLSEVTLTVPSIVVGVVLTVTLGQSLRNLVVILVLGGWISYARVLRLQSRSLSSSDYVLYARSLGSSSRQIAVNHLIPNLLSTILVLFFQTLGGMMLWEASLTYLGLGAKPDTITLGGIVRDGQEQIFAGWWIGVFSGMTVALAIISFAFLGDWLRSALDRTTHRDTLFIGVD